MSYAKVFDSMLTSSVWQESHATVRVWFTMLLMKDQDGVVNASVPGLAYAAAARSAWDKPRSSISLTFARISAKYGRARQRSIRDAS